MTEHNDTDHGDHTTDGEIRIDVPAVDVDVDR
jgi:hypothetical protein